MPPGLGRVLAFRDLSHEVLELIFSLAFECPRNVKGDIEEEARQTDQRELGSYAFVFELDIGWHY